MDTTYDDGNLFKFRLTTRLLQFLAENRIWSHANGTNRWVEGQEISAFRRTPLERYLGVYTGNFLPPWGAFTYSFSPLNHSVRVGRYCSIASNVRIMGAHHAYHFVSSTEILYRQASPFQVAFRDYGVERKLLEHHQKRPPIIGNDVWIGQDVLLANGITIGDGVVVGAGAVVTKDVAPYSIIGGVPAKIIKMRFKEHIVSALLQTKWWDYPLPLLKGLSFDDPERFVDEVADIRQTASVPTLTPLGETWDILTAVEP